jgi:hypothetical protein
MWVCSTCLDVAYPLHMRQHHLCQQHTNPQPLNHVQPYAYKKMAVNTTATALWKEARRLTMAT